VKRAIPLICLLAACHATSRAERFDAAGQHEKNPARAVDEFTQALDLEPERAEFWLHRGDARARQGDVEGAIADFTRSLELAPTGTAYLHRARARRRKLLLDLALLDLAKAEELDPALGDPIARERSRIEDARTGKPSGE
jgi:tetratricopeptide (TPR) repeat protein